MTKEEFIKAVYERLYGDKIYFDKYNHGDKIYHARAEDWDRTRNEFQCRIISECYNTHEELIEFMFVKCKKLLEDEIKEIKKLILSVGPFN